MVYGPLSNAIFPGWPWMENLRDREQFTHTFSSGVPEPGKGYRLAVTVLLNSKLDISNVRRSAFSVQRAACFSVAVRGTCCDFLHVHFFPFVSSSSRSVILLPLAVDVQVYCSSATLITPASFKSSFRSIIKLSA